MSKTTLTAEDVVYIRWGKRIRRQHFAVRRRLRKVCAHCGAAWGKYGCAEYLWATDYLSQFSLIVLPDRPPKPRHRHRPGYIRVRDRFAADVKHACQRHLARRLHPLPA